MKSLIKTTGILFLIILLAFCLYNFLADAAYDDQHWIYRKMSDSIEESVKRGVFVKELNYKIDSFAGSSFKFEAFIEKAFTHGHKSVHETILIEATKFPYRLSFNSRPNNAIGIFIRPDQLEKFDSSNAVWGFLKYPKLPDTIILEIRGEGIKSGLIKVW